MEIVKSLESIAQAFVIVGAFIFLFLGMVHLVLTLRDLAHPRSFTPQDPALRQAMQHACLAIHPQTNLWRAWLGFNFSHGLGLILFGGAFVDIGLFYFSPYAQALLMQGCVLLVSTVYLLLSLKFWFSTPAICSGIALICFVIASALLAA